MKKIIVTGGCGFIGSHLVEHLTAKGYTVTAFDRYNSNNNWGFLEKSKFKNDFKVILGDVRDFDSVKKAIGKTCYSPRCFNRNTYSYISLLY